MGFGISGFRVESLGLRKDREGVRRVQEGCREGAAVPEAAASWRPVPYVLGRV